VFYIFWVFLILDGANYSNSCNKIIFINNSILKDELICSGQFILNKMAVPPTTGKRESDTN